MSNLLLTVGVTSAILLGVTGCSVADSQQSPAGTVPASATPSEQPAETIYGDVIGLEEVTDQYGTYEKTTINPEAASMQLNPAVIDSSGEGNGFTNEDILAAQQFVVRFVAEEGADSSALDDTNAWDAWKQDIAPTYLDPAWASTLLTTDNNGTASTITANDNVMNGLLPPLVRDGKPRLSSNIIDVTKVDAVNEDGVSYIRVYGTTATDYRIPETTAQERLLSANPGVDETTLKAQHPGTFDGKDDTYAITNSWMYVVKKDASAPHGWYISGFTSQFHGTNKE